MKSPRAKTLPFTVNRIAEKSGFPTSAAIRGVRRSLVSAATTAANAPPTTTPTAMSTTLPRNTNCLNPLIMDSLQEDVTAQSRAALETPHVIVRYALSQDDYVESPTALYRGFFASPAKCMVRRKGTSYYA